MNQLANLAQTLVHHHYETQRGLLKMITPGNYEPTDKQLELFDQSWIPNYAYGRKTIHSGTYKYSRNKALECDYIEANKTGRIQSLIVIDYDGITPAQWQAERVGMLEPSWVALNPYTNTGHITYALASPVPLTDASRRPPVNYLARIETGLLKILEGDPAYSKLLTKNPLRHPTVWGERRYQLKELATRLDELNALPRAGNPRRNVTTSAIGRNVALFDLTRTWGYSAVRRYYGAPYSEWRSAVFAHAWETNETVIANEFSRGGMSAQEIGHISNSVANWIWQKFDESAWIKRQTALGERSAAARKAKAAEWQAIAARGDQTPEQIAELAQIKPERVRRYLNEINGGHGSAIEARRARVQAARAAGYTLEQIAAVERTSLATIRRDLHALNT